MLARILKLARENERLVIFDSETEHAFVVLPLGVYEQLRHEAGCEFDDELDDLDEDGTPPALNELDDIWTSPSEEAGSYRAALQDDSPEASRLTDQNMIDSIEHDIATWKAAQEEVNELTLTPLPGAEGQATPPASGEEEKFYIEPVS